MSPAAARLALTVAVVALAVPTLLLDDPPAWLTGALAFAGALMTAVLLSDLLMERPRRNRRGR